MEGETRKSAGASVTRPSEPPPGADSPVSTHVIHLFTRWVGSKALAETTTRRSPRPFWEWSHEGRVFPHRAGLEHLTARVHARRTAGGDRHHRRARRAVASRDPGRARGR